MRLRSVARGNSHVYPGVMDQTLSPYRNEADPDESMSLPGWLYRDEEFFAYEAGAPATPVLADRVPRQ